MDRFDLAVIGGGPGGYMAAIKAARLGATVALVEKDMLGGTCLNWGCIPTKALLRSAQMWREIRHAGELGIELAEPKVNYARMVERKNNVVAGLVAGIETLMKKNNITVFRSMARINEPGKVLLVNAGRVIEQITAGNLIIATGSMPATVPVPGLELPGVLNSDGALKLTEIPDALLVIGGGVIGMEFATIFSSFGTKVTVVEMLPAILPMVDEELTKRLRPIMKKEGIDIYPAAKVKAVQMKGQGLSSIVETVKGELEFHTSKVLVAVGRIPRTTGIEVEPLGLAMAGRGIKVNNRMETNIPGIYAVGDVTGGAMLAHVASFEGIVAASNALGYETTMDYRVVPSCIFCYPEIASVGMTEKEAEEQGDEYQVSKFPFTANGKALAVGEALGFVKLIAQKSSGVIIGGQIMGPHAADLIAEVGLAIKAGLTGEQVAGTIHAHPTLAETVMEAALGLVDKPFHLA